ncbi:MAG: hypothetical protein EI684_17425 [Candidatus Viridilinea halotolerans]|uniref:Uncharacterized protein n=1 Tax=Candidatus Viridilinea halotolerans TaxID=2491704 RepID=A0A426TU58_9CHLR|nr:MAG: hypothetical protein EI684_17425 [Candidatus Viridilinea halotolerans]
MGRTTTTTAPDLTTGLVAAYGFDEGSGTTTADATANGLDGTSVELMVLTAIEWFSSGVYDKDPIDDDLRLAIRRRMNSRIPVRTTTL